MKQPDIINWSAVSEILTGKTKRVSRSYIPKKHRAAVENLLKKIGVWEKEIENSQQ